jgi:hypothetical protein
MKIRLSISTSISINSNFPPTCCRKNPSGVFHTQVLLVDANVANQAETHSREEIQHLWQGTVQPILLHIKPHDIGKVFGQVCRHDVEAEVDARLADDDGPDWDRRQNRFEGRRWQVCVSLQHPNFLSQIILFLFRYESIRLGVFGA